jgi:anti-sigma regulatory factor (Ser/Thr protein kinase)
MRVLLRLRDEQTVRVTVRESSRADLLFGPGSIGQAPDVEHRLPYDVASIRSARGLVRDFAEDRLSGLRLDELTLMVSEVVTNAVRHGSPEPDGSIGLRLEEDKDSLRVVVTDGGGPFAFDPGSVEDEKRNEHFGLLFVDRLADRWGLSLDGKKAIWLEVDARKPS